MCRAQAPTMPPTPPSSAPPRPQPRASPLCARGVTADASRDEGSGERCERTCTRSWRRRPSSCSPPAPPPLAAPSRRSQPRWPPRALPARSRCRLRPLLRRRPCRRRPSWARARRRRARRAAPFWPPAARLTRRAQSPAASAARTGGGREPWAEAAGGRAHSGRERAVRGRDRRVRRRHCTTWMRCSRCAAGKVRCFASGGRRCGRAGQKGGQMDRSWRAARTSVAAGGAARVPVETKSRKPSTPACSASEGFAIACGRLCPARADPTAWPSSFRGRGRESSGARRELGDLGLKSGQSCFFCPRRFLPC